MRVDLPLRGAGGEPVDLRRTIHSHGLVRLAPNAVFDDGAVLQLPLRLADGRAVFARIGPGGPGLARVDVVGGGRGQRVGTEVAGIVRRILHLDADYSEFYERAARDPALRWVAHGAGRFVRSPSAFEDVVKTICTTNCTWSATIRMTNALVAELGDPVAARPGVRLFPTPQALAEAPATWYRDVARLGYRGPYVRAIAGRVADGTLDLEAWAAATPDELSDDELERQLRGLPGIGPYAAAHVMLLMGRFSRLVLDSATRAKYARLSGRKPRSDAVIVRRFKPYGRFAGLAFWCYVTSDWVDDASAETIAERTVGSASSASA